MTCRLCRGRAGAHFHWCTAVGGPGHKPSISMQDVVDLLTNPDPPPEPVTPAPARPDSAPEEVATSPVAPPPVRATDPVADYVASANRSHREAQETRRPSLMQPLAPPKPEPEYPRAEAIRIAKLRDATAELAPAVRWRHIVGDVPSDWIGIDEDQLGAVAHSLADFCRTHGLPISYKIKEDVLALAGFDETEVHTALTNPQRVEVRPETWAKDKRYPVLAFRRGDVMVILGLREPDSPAVIAAYWTSLLAGYDPTSHRERSGGGGAKLTGGLPSTPRALVRRLTMMGAYVDPEWSTTDNPVEVIYDGQNLGMIPTAPRTPKAEIVSAYQRCQRKIHAIDQRASSPAGQR